MTTKTVWAGYINYYISSQPGILKTHYFYNAPDVAAVQKREDMVRTSASKVVGSNYYERPYDDKKLW